MGLDHVTNAKKKELKDINEFSKDFEKFDSFIFHFWPIVELNESKQNVTEQDEDDQLINSMIS